MNAVDTYTDLIYMIAKGFMEMAERKSLQIDWLDALHLAIHSTDEKLSIVRADEEGDTEAEDV